MRNYPLSHKRVNRVCRVGDRLVKVYKALDYTILTKYLTNIDIFTICV